MTSTLLSLVGALSWSHLVILIGIIAITYWYFKSQAPFKKYASFPQVKPHWFIGNKSFGLEALNDTHMNIYNKLKGNRYGIYWEGNIPVFYLLDLDLIKQVQIADFDHFMDLAFVPLQYHKKMGSQFGLADTFGEPWRRMKRMVTPPFSVPRLKKTTPTINIAVKMMIKYLMNFEKKGDVVNMTKALQKYAMTVIGSVGFGTEMNCFTDETSELEKAGIGLIEMWRLVIADLFPDLMTFFSFNMLNPKSIRYIDGYFRKMVKQRKQSKVEGKDVLGNMIQASEENPELTEEIMIKSFLQFFTDGYSTASDVIGVIIYQLTINTDVQERAQEEIDEILSEKGDGNDEITNAELGEMTYLDLIISEGLRLAAIAFTNRFCTKDWTIPGENVVIRKGTKVMIPICGLQYDPDYFEEPFKFDPDRFNSENKGKIPAGAYQPFGNGPRMCLGYNLMKLETKIMLAHLLKNFSLQKHGNMPQKMEWDLNAFAGVKGGVNIKIVQRS